MLGVKHCVAMCNGTVALEIAIRAIGLTGEVIVPSFTFVATAHALQWQEITPVFCDVDSTTHNLDPAQLESDIGRALLADAERRVGKIDVIDDTWGLRPRLSAVLAPRLFFSLNGVPFPILKTATKNKPNP